ncbi:MAG: shikimate dehydrogenase [Alphaproteobacteria bacterium]|nr:shikimate dehydrogenase [Alphaproteobacteria bacterium]
MHYPSGKTHLYAILAHPVAHVRASEFFGPIIEAEQRDAFVVPLHVLPKDLPEMLPMLQRIGNLKGAVITIPHKETMARLCDEMGPNGQLAGAVNTVRFEEGGRLVGDMFDGVGLVNAARANGIEPKGAKVLMLGAGGAARAIAIALADEGALAITIANRTESRAKDLAAVVQAVFEDVEVKAGPADATGHDLVVNCTSLGLEPGDPTPMDPATLRPDMRLFDIIAPRDTELMDAARAAGLKTVIGGRPMVEHQVVAQLNFLGAPKIGST